MAGIHRLRLDDIVSSTLCIQVTHPDWPNDPKPAMVTVDENMKPLSLVIMDWKPIGHYCDYVRDSVDEAIRTGNYV
jgi:hypothetical protein